jgi:alkanesulfonate monooxygenase SsuD/methylene tetrahydromethanopterin reductase-like flavin-dependent oxidoreductase (luciferase family)
MWIGAGTSLDSIELAARLGIGLMLPTVFGKPEDFQPMVRHYQQKWEEYGHDPADRRIAACSHAWVAQDSVSARRQWEPRYKAYIDWVNQLIATSTGRPEIGLGKFDYEDRCRTTAIAGSPAEVANRIGEIAEVLNLDTYLLKFDMGGMPFAEIATAIELAGAEVIPQLG